MSKRQGLASKLFAVLGGAGLAIGICAARASAQAAPPVPPFGNANYANRYVCNVTEDDNFGTGIMKLNPDGNGTYTAGTLEASGTLFLFFDPTKPPTGNFCTYSLDVSHSSYSFDTHGVGTEVLVWTAAGSNDPACPCSPTNLCNGTSSFTMANTTVMRQGFVTSDNRVIRTEITSGNLLDDDEPGWGQCVK